MRRLLIAALTAAVAACSGPTLLTRVDRIAGGTQGVTRVASGVPFGSHDQRLDIWRPRAPYSEGLPVIVFFYGGGWNSGTRQGYGFAARALAAQGFIVVVPDYRKVPQVRFPAFLEDGAEAVRWTRDRISEYGGEPRRLGLMGHSAGAYIVAMLALDKRWLQDAQVDPAIVRAGVGLSGPYDFYPFDTLLSTEAMGGAPDPRATQPVNFVRHDAPPLLLATGTGDTLVRPTNTRTLAERLRAAGARVEIIAYPDIGHAATVMALSAPFRGRAPVLRDSATFLHRELVETGRE